MIFEDTKAEKIKTIKWFLGRPWVDDKFVFDKYYFARSFSPDDGHVSLEAKDVVLIENVRECVDFLDAFQELAKKHYDDEFCWCGPQVMVAVAHAAFARILLEAGEGNGGYAYGKMSAVKWHCFPVARLNEGLSYHDWLRALDPRIHESGEGDKPYDLYDSQREAAFFILNKIGLEPSCLEKYFRGLTKEEYVRNIELAESGHVDAAGRLIDYHLRASFLPGSREKKKNELLARELLWKYGKVASLKHCMCAGATFYAGRIDSILTPPFRSGDPGDVEDFLSSFPSDIKRALRCLEFAISRYESGDVTFNGWKVEKKDILRDMASLSLADEIANSVSLPLHSQSEEVFALAKAYACLLVLPLFTASRTDKVDELAIEWGRKLGTPFFRMMSSVYAWRGEVDKQYAWANLGFIEHDVRRRLPLSLYPEEEVFPMRVRLSPSELQEAQGLTFSLLKQLLSADSAALPVSRFTKFRLGLVKLIDTGPYCMADDGEILSHALGCLCGNISDHCSWLRNYGSSPQDYAGALAWFAVLANVEDEVLAKPRDIVQLIVKGLEDYSAHYSCDVFLEDPSAREFLINKDGWAMAILSTLPESTIKDASELLRRIKNDGWKS